MAQEWPTRGFTDSLCIAVPELRTSSNNHAQEVDFPGLTYNKSQLGVRINNGE